MNNVCTGVVAIRTSLLEFLLQNRILIPILQRDYAQGREGKEEMRRAFLRSFHEALCGEGGNVELDFVYGVVSESRDGAHWVAPLDGQQRLTTAWLVHCYVAYKSGVLLNNHMLITTLKRFTYRTRTSSNQFCQQLVDFLSMRSYEKNEVLAEVIENQTWFAVEWKSDPTIESMLRMLSGSRSPVIKNKEVDHWIGNVDGIEQIFVDGDDYTKAWGRLAAGKGNCPVSFYFYPLNDFKHPDELYVKMNARGKPLTSFENLKADLGAYVYLSEPELECAVNFECRFSHKIDGVWTDLFWKNRSDEPRVSIDEIYIAFINRFCLNRFIARYEGASKKLERSKTFTSLYGSEGNDTKYVYKSFDSYREALVSGGASSLSSVLDGYSVLIEGGKPEQIDNRLFGISYIPKYSYVDVDGEQLPNVVRRPEMTAIDSVQEIHLCSRITQPERVKFHAVSLFLEFSGESLRSEQKLSDWMRFVDNVVGNSEIKTIDQMVRGIRMFDKLGRHSADILSYLADPSTTIDSVKNECGAVLNSEQVAEEIIKARKMTDRAWATKILHAEKHAFLGGAIRCLIYNAAGEADWDNFDLRLKTFDKYFTEQGLTAAEVRPIVEIVKRSSVDQLKSYSFDLSSETWKRILSQSQYRSVVDSFLRECSSPTVFCDEGLVNELCQESFLLARMKQGGSWHLLWDWQGAHWVLTQYARREKNPNRVFANQIWVLGRGRNRLIKMICCIDGIVPMTTSLYESESGCYAGLYWDFSYEKCEFRLSGDGLVALMKAGWRDSCNDENGAIVWNCRTDINALDFQNLFAEELKKMIERGKKSGAIQ